MAFAVKPGFRGKFEIHIDYVSSSPTYAELNVRQMTVRETVDRHDTSGTASPKTASKFILQETNIPGKARCRVNINAQYQGLSVGASDPPDFGGEKLYGNQAIRAQAGDTVVGVFGVEDYGNSLNVDGTIDYDFAFISNGTYTRTKGSPD